MIKKTEMKSAFGFFLAFLESIQRSSYAFSLLLVLKKDEGYVSFCLISRINFFLAFLIVCLLIFVFIEICSFAF